MATRDAGDESDGGTLPRVLPFSLDHVTRLSWELGARTVGDERATRRGEWTRSGSQWTLSVYDVTSSTVVLCVRTPVGRERFYGAARIDLDSALSALEDAREWHPSKNAQE
jgi:hypothetical protein